MFDLYCQLSGGNGLCIHLFIWYHLSSRQSLTRNTVMKKVDEVPAILLEKQDEVVTGGRRSGWQSRRMWVSPSPMNTTDIHLYVEKFSLKINWELTEAFLDSQDCRKDPQTQIGREEMRLCWDRCPGRGLREKVMWSEWFWPHSGRPAYSAHSSNPGQGWLWPRGELSQYFECQWTKRSDQKTLSD